MVTICTDVEAIVKSGPDRNFPESIYLRAGDSLWEVIPDPKGRMPDFLGNPSSRVKQLQQIQYVVGDRNNRKTFHRPLNLDLRIGSGVRAFQNFGVLLLHLYLDACLQ